VTRSRARVGIAAIVYAGVGIGVIGQSNYVEVDGFTTALPTW
jgi:hypothetical protein